MGKRFQEFSRDNPFLENSRNKISPFEYWKIKTGNMNKTLNYKIIEV